LPAQGDFAKRFPASVIPKAPSAPTNADLRVGRDRAGFRENDDLCEPLTSTSLMSAQRCKLLSREKTSRAPH
jgi:hypothetical protein